MFFNDRYEIELAVAPQEMLVDRDVAYEAEALFVVTHHDRIRLRVAADQVGANDGGAGRRAADDSAPPQQGAQLGFRARAQVRIRNPPLPATREPDGPGRA